MKNIIFKIASMAVLFIAIIYFSVTLPFNWDFLPEKDNNVSFRTNEKTIQIEHDGKWQNFEIKGINIGTGYPGVFPNESGISKSTYYRWFEMIAEMNANTIRVYKIQSPEFYSALKKYNDKHKDKLYLIQGVDFSDYLMYSEKNILEYENHKELFKDTFDTVDALHGDSILFDVKRGDLSIYYSDVSDYVLGYILGVEWDEVFVDYVCRKNPNVRGYNGKYLYCRDDTSAFEVFLSEWGDSILDYEQEKYAEQKLLSFCNWPDTDPFINEFRVKNPNDDVQKDVEALIDIDRIHTKENVKSGIFVSYNVYPYFPSFLQYSPYTKYIDETGKANPYRKYLMTLTEHHKYPVIISEFGIPASRSKAYDEMWNGFSHGGLTEKQQGEALVKMYNDIKKSGCAGSIAFTWQDEWYKTAWNEKLISNADRRAFWPNAQCPEQYFGVLAFEPQTEDKIVYPDTSTDDWSKKDIVSKNDTMSLSMKSDSKYLYLMVDSTDKRKNNNLINIALDISPEYGSHDDSGKSFSRDIDFIITIDSKEKGHLYVHKDYDILRYSALGGYNSSSVNSIYNMSDNRNNMNSFLSKNSDFIIVSRASGNIISFMEQTWIVNEVGVLNGGNSNPKSDNYNSNADFCVNEGKVEIRIPWQLLNFTDPSKHNIVANLKDNNFNIVDKKINNIYAAAYYDDETQIDDFGKLKLKSWNKPKFHERKKESYYILQKAFGGEVS